jgi:hypothetical protein
MISLDQVVSRDEKTASRILAGEAVVLTPMDSRIHGLNETGTRIWELLADEITVGEIAAHIHREFKVSQEQAQADVIAFIEELAARGMVTLGERPEQGAGED